MARNNANETQSRRESVFVRKDSVHHELDPEALSLIVEVLSVNEDLDPMCRICLSADSTENLISPCLCKGTIAFVHPECLEYYLNQRNEKKCPVCKYEFKTKTGLKYTMCESIGKWINTSPRRRNLFFCDMLLYLLLSIVTFGLIRIMSDGLRRVVRSPNLTDIVLLSFTALFTTFTYIRCSYIVYQSQVRPWYRWWQSVKTVKLVTEP